MKKGKALYLGIDPSAVRSSLSILHFPLIQVVPRKKEELAMSSAFFSLQDSTHCIFTSKNAVRIFFSIARELNIPARSLVEGKCFSIGPHTSFALQQEGISPLQEAPVSTQEGVIAMLESIPLQEAHVLYPRSVKARPLLLEFLRRECRKCEVLDLYDTVSFLPGPPPLLEEVEEIIFTSPSTVEAFFQIYPQIPAGVHIRFQGPITQKFFQEKLAEMGQTNYANLKNFIQEEPI